MPDLEFENRYRRKGVRFVAGLDEAGRGPLAGPVTAAAVIIPKGFSCGGLDDSKRLSEKKRERIYQQLTQSKETFWAVGFAEAEEIDQLNILQATHLAMTRAVEALDCAVEFCLVDGLPIKDFGWPHEAIVRGDGKSVSIAAASVIAKVARDQRMVNYAKEYPSYGFDRHKGYGTKHHLEALRVHGPCRIHRRSFQPVAQSTMPFIY